MCLILQTTLLLFAFHLSQSIEADTNYRISHLQKLSSNMAKMFEDRENNFDLVLSVNKQRYTAHKCILSSSSPYLRFVSFSDAK